MKTPSSVALHKAVDKENNRVGHEWDALLKTEHTEQDRIDLADKQAARWNRMIINCGYFLKDNIYYPVTPKKLS